MVDLTFLVVLILVFGVIYFIDLIFRTCFFFPYFKLLHVTGITIKPFAVVWETTKFNRTFYRWSRFKPAFLRTWFQTGTYVSLICMIPALLIVSHSFWLSLEKSPSKPNYDESVVNNHIAEVMLNKYNGGGGIIDGGITDGDNDAGVDHAGVDHAGVDHAGIDHAGIDHGGIDDGGSSSSSSSSTPLIIPIIPGLTLPFSQILFYIVTLFLCMLFHEMGHAVASSRENVVIDGCGIGLYGVFPLAYVKLPTERFSHLLPWQQLRIYCAGIWHNIVLSGFALCLMWCSPLFLSLVFQSESGISVVSVKEGSGVAQPGGLVANDQILSINDCEVKNINSWEECLKKLHINAHQGFCSSYNFVRNEDIKKENSTSCCPDSNEYLCFQHMNNKECYCLPGRRLAEKAKVCNFNEDCSGRMCLVPAFLSNYDKFLRIERHLKNSVLYIGSIQELKSTVAVSGWTERFKVISVRYADIYETILVYIVTFSSGLAIMNLIPCYGFDGAYLTEILVHHYMSNVVPQIEHRRIIIHSSNFLGLFMSVYSIIYGTVKYMT